MTVTRWLRLKKTATAFFSVPATHIELVAPLAGTGPIASYLEKRGGRGYITYAFRTDDIDADVVRLRDKGYQFIGDNPSPGAHGARVIFIHPKSLWWCLNRVVAAGRGRRMSVL